MSTDSSEELTHNRPTPDGDVMMLHQTRLLQAVADEVPEAFRSFEETVFKASLPLWIEVGPASKLTFTEILAHPLASDALHALQEWERTWNLVPTQDGEQAMNLWAVVQTYTWATDGRARQKLVVADIGELTGAGLRRRESQRKREPRPPSARPGEGREAYLKRAETYWIEKTAFDEGSPRVTFEKRWDKKKPDHYRWAAYYQCKPGATQRSTLEQYVEDTSLSERAIGEAIRDTLRKAHIRLRRGSRGPRAAD